MIAKILSAKSRRCRVLHTLLANGMSDSASLVSNNGTSCNHIITPMGSTTYRLLQPEQLNPPQPERGDWVRLPCSFAIYYMIFQTSYICTTKFVTSLDGNVWLTVKQL